METIFWYSTKCLGLVKNVYQFLVRPKKFWGPVEGQGIWLQSPKKCALKLF
jgi:hypothetical protein